MSNFRAMTRATDKALQNAVDKSFAEWQPADWLDDYYGKHCYGIRFDGDPIVRADNGDFIYNHDVPALLFASSVPHVSFHVRGYHPLWPAFPDRSVKSRAITSSFSDFARHYFRNLG